VGADEMMQAFFYKQLVPASDLTLVPEDRSRFRGSGGKPANASRAGRPPFQSQWAILDEQPVRIPVGGTAEVHVRMPADRRGETQVELSDPPEGIAVERVSWTDKVLAVVLRGDAEKAKPGLKGNLMANAFSKSAVTTNDGKTRDVRNLIGPLPAIPFEVVKP
jgi:hypothetical protein